MRLGISSYCLAQHLHSGEMTLLDVLDWCAEQGLATIEFAPIGYSFEDNDELLEAVIARCKEHQLEVVCYSIAADFMSDDPAERAKELERVKGQIDLAARLGATCMRHDIVSWAADPDVTSAKNFDRLLPRLVEACRQTASYAAEKGVTILVENHGQIMNGHERLIRLAEAVDHENFGLLTDLGNLWCVDDDPVAGVPRMLKYSKHLHCKDFYQRPQSEVAPGEHGWFKSRAGYWLRGAIFNEGDLNVRQVLKSVREAGYDGSISLEFEGLEECRMASADSLKNIQRLWDEVGA